MEAIENYPSGGDSAPLDNGAFRNILYCTAKRHPNKDVYHTTITLSCCQVPQNGHSTSAYSPRFRRERVRQRTAHCRGGFQITGLYATTTSNNRSMRLQNDSVDGDRIAHGEPNSSLGVRSRSQRLRATRRCQSTSRVPPRNTQG
jgi:hypothetical protein